MSASKSTAQYLSRYAEPEALIALNLFRNSKLSYGHALLVPVYDEQPDFFNGIKPALREDTLTVLIFNAPIDSAAAGITQTQNTLRHFQAHGECIESTEDNQVQLVKYEGHSLLLVDRAHSDRLIPKKQGVGLARKIGADVICQLITHHFVSSPWIYSTDADVVLPLNYFQSTNALDSHSAVVFPFQHFTEKSPELNAANLLYETKLHYYVAGLNHANSPYAFHTIGSTMAFHANFYAMVRGFPKRAGGEDFYLLNKLVKLAPLKSLEMPTIQIQARESHRVPFGTGPALTEIQGLENAIENYQYYHPFCFELLKLWLESFNLHWNLKQSTTDILSREIFKQLINAHHHSDKRELFFNALIHMDTYFKLSAHAQKLKQQTQDRDKFLHQMHVWFDGFKTLKFIHIVRDCFFPSINLSELNQAQEFFPQSNETLQRLI